MNTIMATVFRSRVDVVNGSIEVMRVTIVPSIDEVQSSCRRRVDRIRGTSQVAIQRVGSNSSGTGARTIAAFRTA